jgi:hypothetical protein
MPGPTKKATLQLIVRHTLFSGSVAEAIEETKDLGQQMMATQQQALDLMNQIQGAEFDVVRKRAVLNYLNAQLDEAVVNIGAEARSVDRRNPQLGALKRLFPKKTPSEIIRPSGTGVDVELDDCRSILQAATALPDQADLQTLKALLSAMEQCVNKCDAALAGVKAALTAHRTVRLRIPEFRNQVRRQFDTFYGELLRRFPGRRDFIKSFFLPADLQKPEPDDGTNPPPTPA